MHTLRVVRDPCGWTVELGPGIVSPFRSRAQAIEAAECVCSDLRRHGEDAEVRVEDAANVDFRPSDQHVPERLADLLRAAHARMGR